MSSISPPSMPSRPTSNNTVGGLVSSRVKAFGSSPSSTNFVTKSGPPPALPSKPKHVIDAANALRKSTTPAAAELASSKNIHQMARAFETTQSMGIVQGKSTTPAKPPIPLPKNVGVNSRPSPIPTAIPTTTEAIRQSNSDFSIKAMKSMFENSGLNQTTARRIDNQSTAVRSSANRPISEHFAVDDLNNNNNPTKVKSIRAELESKLHLWSPGSPPQFNQPHHQQSSIDQPEQTTIDYRQQPSSFDYRHHQQPPPPSLNDHRQSSAQFAQPSAIDHNAIMTRSQFDFDSHTAAANRISTISRVPFSNSYTDGFNYGGGASSGNAINNFGYEERPVLPTMMAKSKPPPRPPPAAVPSNNKSASAIQQSGGYQQHQEYSRTPSPNEAYAIVIYDFHGEHSDELSSKRGDELSLKHEVDDEWFYAHNSRTGRTGIIPKSFLEVKVPLPTVQGHAHSDEDSGVESTADGPRCYTLHDFVSNVDGDLTFLKGEVIKLTNRVNAEWVEGESHDGRRGIFPISFVEVIEDFGAFISPSPAQSHSMAASPKVESVTAIYDFYGENPGDLSLAAGERIVVESVVNSDWLFGTSVATNQSGIFPSTFVDRIPHGLSKFDSH